VSGSLSRTLAPGESDEISVKVKLGRKPGPTMRILRLSTNDRNNPSAKLTARATVMCAMKLKPLTVTFGTIQRDSGPVTKSIMLEAADAGPITPKLVSTGRETISAELKEIEPHQKYELSVTMKPPWPNERVRGSIRVETGVKESPEDEVFYQAIVEPRLLARPNQLRLPIEPEEDVEMLVNLVWSDERPPSKIRSVVCTAPDVDVKLEDRQGEPVVVVKVPKGFSTTRTQGYKIMVHTDDPVAPRLDIPVRMMRVGRSARGSAAQGESQQKPVARRGTVGQAGSINPGAAAPNQAGRQRLQPRLKPMPRERRGTANPNTPVGNSTAANQPKARKPQAENPENSEQQESDAPTNK